MEHDSTERTAPIRDTRGVHTNTRFTSPLVINSASRRRSLFSRPRVKEDATRPTSSGSASDAKFTSPSNTKIPRPTSRRPFTLSDAYRMAEEEEAARGSPSPAPRSWRSRPESAEQRTIKTANAAPADLQQRGRIDGKFVGPEQKGGTDESDLSDNTFDKKLRQHALDQTGSEEPFRRSNGLLSRSKLGGKIVETGKELLVRKPSRSSLDNVSSPRAAKAATNNQSLMRRLSGQRQESGATSQAPESADGAQADNAVNAKPLHLVAADAVHLGAWTPNRSFAWQADADFTPGDLQVSNSPPVAIGRSNTKIDEIRALEAELNEHFSGNPRFRPRNTRIDSIRVLEMETTLKLPDAPVEPDEAPNLTEEVGQEGEGRVTHGLASQPPGARMDERRSREIERLSRRALATARLDEFRGRNIGVSRSPSPDIARKSSREPRRASSRLRDGLRRQGNEGLVVTLHAQEVPASQSTLASTGSAPVQSPNMPAHTSNIIEKGEGQQSLGRLAAVTSSSTVQKPPVAADSEASGAPPDRDQDAAGSARQKRLTGGAKSDVRTVGFAGLQRTSSVESGLVKRTSFVHSDSDPTERIEGEMKLFAPMENQSERGSLRAPSPEPEEEAPEETPKPPKIDPSLQPTPKVTGAFIETPGTIKVEDVGNNVLAASAKTKGAESGTSRARRLSMSGTGECRPPLRQGGKGGEQHRTQSMRDDRLARRSLLLPARRRARSLSRSRAPLVNSARPPTVKDDLLAIQHANQFDDSTLDDIADLVSGPDDLDAVLGSRDIKLETTINDRLDRKKELEAYDRMSRSLTTGLLGIRTAKQGIERLEDKVAHADTRERPSHAACDDSIKGESPRCPICHGSQPSTGAAITYVHLPLPRLWHRRPKFRFTFLGLSLFLLSLWCIAESWMCSRYCKPEYCYPGTPCDWSPDDPAWGYAIPVKMDQWVTGGQGRKRARRLELEVADWLADMWDAATGVDITTVDTSRFSWEQNRQHRRRLAKKGLGQPFVERPEDKPIFSAWKSVRVASERAQSALEMGYPLGEDESIANDERL